MVPKKRSERKKSGKAEEKPSDYQIRLDFSNELEPSIRKIVRKLMFASGDSENPIPENESHVLNILKNELILLFDDILAVYDRIHFVKLVHMLSVLQSQKELLSRFLKYLKVRVEMASFMRAKNYKDNLGETEGYDDDKRRLEEIDEIGEVTGAEGEYLNKKRKKFGSVTADEDLLKEVKRTFTDVGLKVEKFEEDDFDEQKAQAFQEVIQNMTSDEYNEFARCRRISFHTHSTVPHPPIVLETQPRKRKRNVPTNNRQTLLVWLGNPPVQGEPAHVFLAFLAKEIVSEVVGAALLERSKTNASESGPIRRKYYEETLRKNKRFRMYGRLFF